MTSESSSEQDLSRLRPVRLAEWTERDGRIVLERPMPPGGGVKGLLRRISALTGVKRLRLDELGTFVWRRLDGAASAAEIARALESEKGGEAEAAGERVERFLILLRREGLVGFPGIDDEAIEALARQAAGNSG